MNTILGDAISAVGSTASMPTAGSTKARRSTRSVLRNRTNGTVGYNDRSNDYQLNQMYFRMVRDVGQDCDRWDIGGRVDLLYGTDWVYAAARGLEVTDDYSSRWNAQRTGWRCHNSTPRFTPRGETALT